MQIQLTPTWPALRNSYILLHATVSPSIHPSIHPLVVQWLNHVQLLATPRTSTGQAPLSFTMSWSVLKFMSFESVVLSKHLILCHTLHLFPSVLPSIRVFSNKSALLIRWLKYWSFSISPSVNIQGWFPLGWGFPCSSAGKEPPCKARDLVRSLGWEGPLEKGKATHSSILTWRIPWTGLDLLTVQGTLKSLLQCHSSKASTLQYAAFFIVQLWRPYMTIGKPIALTIQTVGKVMSMLFNMLPRFVIAFLPKNKCLLISCLQSPSTGILEPKETISVTASSFPPSYLLPNDETRSHDLSFLNVEF